MTLVPALCYPNGMKLRCTLLLSLLLLLASSRAAQPVFLVEITGAVYSTPDAGGPEFELDTTKVNNARIFAEFGVSKEDYALVLDGNILKVLFRQKNSGAGLPDIPVLDISLGSGGVSTDKKLIRAAGPITSPATGNLFEGLEGTGLGTVTFKGPIATAELEKFSIKFLGACRNPLEGASNKAALRFSLKTGKEF